MVSPENIRIAVAVLQEGGLVAFPTETVYGLGAAALNAEAVAKIFEVKQRPRFDPVIVHVANAEQAQTLVTSFDYRAKALASSFWPGPLTLVLPRKDVVPDIVTAGLPSVAVRVPSHPVAQELLQQFGGPIAAPSANRFGSISPTSAEHVLTCFGELFPILDGGPTTVGIESTILDLTKETPVLLRPGATTREQIEQVIGAIEMKISDDGNPTAPGQFPRHYAPRLPMMLIPYDSQPQPIPGYRCACLLPTYQPTMGFHEVEVLSSNNSQKEMAVNLFAALRRLEEMEVDCIIAVEAVPEGLGIAINDRLRRASTPKVELDKELNTDES